jgi:hypothetical protein
LNSAPTSTALDRPRGAKRPPKIPVPCEGTVALQRLGITEEQPTYAHAIDHAHLAGVPRRQSDARTSRRPAHAAHVPRRRRAMLAKPCHAGRSGGLLQPNRPEALRQARHLGLVDWSERRIRAGWRWLRTSNLYRFMVPTEPAAPCSRASCSPRSQVVGNRHWQRCCGRPAGRICPRREQTEAMTDDVACGFR